MNAVRLVEVVAGGDAIEEEGVEEGAVARRQFLVDRVEGGAIVAAEIGRGDHAGEQDRQSAVAETGEQPVEGVAGDRRIDAAEGIVGAELDDDGVGVVADRPVEAGETVARGIAGDPGIDDHHVTAAGGERRLQAVGEGGIGLEAQTGRQAVAEGDDPDRIGERRAGCGRHRQRGDDRQSETQILDRHWRSTI